MKYLILKFKKKYKATIRLRKASSNCKESSLFNLKLFFSGKPALVRETSRFSVIESLKNPIKTFKKLRSQPTDALAGVVLEPKLEERLRSVILFNGYL